MRSALRCFDRYYAVANGKPQLGKPKGIVYLKYVVSTSNQSTKKGHTLEVQTQKRTYFFRCDTNDERAAWAAALKGAFTPPEAESGDAVSDHFLACCAALRAFYDQHKPETTDEKVRDIVQRYVVDGGDPDAPTDGEAFVASGPLRPSRNAVPRLPP